jgi:hypothetical protein
MATTFAPNATLGARVSLRSPSRCASRKALAAPARVACKARALTTRAVKEVAGADFQAEVLDVRTAPAPVVRVGATDRVDRSNASPRGYAS